MIFARKSPLVIGFWIHHNIFPYKKQGVINRYEIVWYACGKLATCLLCNHPCTRYNRCMNSDVAQIMSPVDHFGKSRFSITFISLVALALILAAVFVWLESGQKVEVPSTVLTAQAKAQYVREMEQVVQNQPALPADQKAALIEAMSAKLQAKK